MGMNARLSAMSALGRTRSNASSRKADPHFRVSESVAALAPHGPHRAELPQWVLQVGSPTIPGVHDARWQQGMAMQKVLVAAPREGLAPRAPVEPLVPETADLPIELP